MWYLFKEKNISDDVHEKTIDNLMGGMEAIMGGIHRNVFLEVFWIYDEKYIQKWFLHDEAVNLLALKAEQIDIKEHYTRLYGPRVEAEKTSRASMFFASSPSRARINQTQLEKEQDVDAGEKTDAELRKTRKSVRINVPSSDQEVLKTAFDSHPYSIYSNRLSTQPNYHAESHVALTDAVKYQQNRTSMLWDKAFSDGKRMSLRKRMSSAVKQEELPQIDEKTEDVATILEVYNDAKTQSKSST